MWRNRGLPPSIWSGEARQRRSQVLIPLVWCCFPTTRRLGKGTVPVLRRAPARFYVRRGSPVGVPVRGSATERAPHNRRPLNVLRTTVVHWTSRKRSLRAGRLGQDLVGATRKGGSRVAAHPPDRIGPWYERPRGTSRMEGAADLGSRCTSSMICTSVTVASRSWTARSSLWSSGSRSSWTSSGLLSSPRRRPGPVMRHRYPSGPVRSSRSAVAPLRLSHQRGEEWSRQTGLPRPERKGKPSALGESGEFAAGVAAGRLGLTVEGATDASKRTSTAPAEPTATTQEDSTHNE